MKRFAFAAMVALMLAPWPSHAQTPPTAPPTSYQPPISTPPVSLSVTNSSARVALTGLPASYPVVTIVNNGAQEIFCNLGGSSVTATTTTGYLFAIQANSYRSTWNNTATYVACITAASTATARITQSNGAPQMGFQGVPQSYGVASFNSRTGAVVPAANDYSFAQLSAPPTTVHGYGITDAYFTASWSTGNITVADAAPSGFLAVVKAATVQNITLSASNITGTNVIVALLDCGADVTCATPTTVGSGSVTAAGAGVVVTVSAAAIAAGDYLAWEITGGVFAAANVFATATLSQN